MNNNTGKMPTSEEKLVAFNLLRKMPQDQLKHIWSQCCSGEMPALKKLAIKGIIASGEFKLTINGTDDEAKQQVAMDTIRRIVDVLTSISNETTARDNHSFDDLILIMADYEPCPPSQMLMLTKHHREVLSNFAMRVKAKQNPIEICDFLRSELVIGVECQLIELITLNLMNSADDLRKRRGNTALHDEGWSWKMLVDAVSHYYVPSDRSVGGGWWKEVHTIPPKSNVQAVHGTEEDLQELSTEPSSPLPSAEPPSSPTPPAPTPPAPAPPAPAPAPTPQSQEPIVTTIVDMTKEERDKLVAETGSLMFPAQRRKISPSQFTKSSWAKLRKEKNISGRWEIYVDTNPSKKHQNKALKYKEPHFCDNWEGSYDVEGWDSKVSDYPYGDILLVKV